MERLLGYLVYTPAFAVLGGVLAAGLAWSHQERERQKLERAQLAQSA